jgi:hypothetical protein
MMRFLVRVVVRLITLGVRWVAIRLSRRKRLQRLERTIREQRLLAMIPITYEPAGARWQPSLDGLEVPPGMSALGDFVEVPAGRAPTGAMRGITDAAGTTFGWVAKAGASGVSVMLLVSANDTGSYVTVLSPVSAGLTASPPFVHRERAESHRSAAAALARHTRRIAGVAGLIRVRTLDELQAALRRLRGKTIDWRAAQPPATLLDADLRSILGPLYDELGARLAKKLGPDLPVARVV